MTELPTPWFPQLYVLCKVRTIKQFAMATTITTFCFFMSYML
jgi:hypothetical protein